MPARSIRASTAASGSSMLAIQIAQPAGLYRRRKLLPELQRISACCSGDGPSFRSSRRRAMLFHRAARRVGIQQEGVKHNVMVEAAALQSPAGPASQGRLHIAGDLGSGRILQPRLQMPPDSPPSPHGFPRLPRESDGIQREFALRRLRDSHRHRIPAGTPASHSRSSSGDAITP